MATIALADDHVLLRNGLASLIKNFGHEVLFEANNGEDLIKLIQEGKRPDLILMDINMPVKDGYETSAWLKINYPEIRILALSMLDDENAIIRMIKNGARGYLLKESEPAELRAAINAVLQRGFYYSEMVTGRLVHSISGTDVESNNSQQVIQLTEREIDFLKFACTEMTYKEIAAEMHLSPRTIDGYRDALFLKLDIKTRTGLVIYAIKNGIVKI
jgi:two-component system, NarL family, invasion response regulator UvrY